jgi:hypothetical protein
MFDSAFKVGGYAVSFQGFLRILKHTSETIVVEHVSTDVTPAQQGGGGATVKPGPPVGADTERTKILTDATSEYVQWGRAKHNPKWRPWNGQPIRYREMSPDYWPRD